MKFKSFFYPTSQKIIVAIFLEVLTTILSMGFSVLTLQLSINKILTTTVLFFLNPGGQLGYVIGENVPLPLILKVLILPFLFQFFYLYILSCIYFHFRKKNTVTKT